MDARFSLTTKIVAGCAATVMSFAILLSVLYYMGYQRAYQSKEDATRHVVEAAWSVIDYYGQRVNSGELTIEQGKSGALAQLKSMRYGKNDYFWINDLQPKMIMHPFNAALNGKDLNDYKDPNGVHLFVEMVKVCQASGEGVVRYSWPKPGASHPMPKISFVKHYQPWGWVVGSGVYEDDIQAQLASMVRFLLVGAGLIVISSLVGAYHLARSISKPLSVITEQLISDSGEITSAVSHMSESTQMVANGSKEQANSVEATEHAVRELRASIQETTSGANNVNELVLAISSVVDDCHQKMGKMTASITDIGASSRRVVDVIGTIEGIAFQTNILALNAAVEAARAGAAGSGFAVVADEVRNLAQKASDAAKKTAELVNDSIEKANAGAKMSKQFADDFNGIVQKTQEASDVVQAIADECNPQLERANEIAKAMKRINEITRANADSTESTSAASLELEHQASELAHILDPLVAIVHGATKR